MTLSPRSLRSLSLISSLWLVLFLLPARGGCMEIIPFATQNQSPLVQIYGLPAAGSAFVLAPGEKEAMLAGDVANNFVKGATTREALLLDGESYRTTLGLRVGVVPRVEVGVELPFAGQGGGIFDSFISDWHKAFGLPREGRDQAPRNRLLYSYTRDGVSQLNINASSFGVGDVRLTSGLQLYRTDGEAPRGVALRGSLKLPTGNSSQLHGSGSTDFALWLTGSDDYRLPIGHATIFGAAGGMAMTRSDVLASLQRSVVAFGSLGGGWSPAQWIAFEVEFSGHTPFYGGSDLASISSSTVQLLVGGTLGFTPTTSLDIAVSEDLTVGTSPDVALHLALRHRF